MKSSAGFHRAVLIIFMVTGFVSAAWAAQLPATQERLDLSTGRLALVVLSIEGGALLGLPLGGYILNRQGSRHAAESEHAQIHCAAECSGGGAVFRVVVCGRYDVGALAINGHTAFGVLVRYSQERNLKFYDIAKQIG